jgi:hypothetical protein
MEKLQLTDHGTADPEHGSFKATRSRNGKHLDQVASGSSGFMGNTSRLPTLALSNGLITPPFAAGFGKSVLRFTDPPIMSS